MIILTILGSPQKSGKTATVLKLVEEKIITQGHEVIRINAAEKQVSGCRGCYACMQVQDAPGCVFQDDMNEIYSKMILADAIVLASPIYCFELTSQIKPLLDRSFALMYTPLLDGKTVAGLITCMGEENGNADLVTQAFRRMFDSSQKSVFKTKLAGTYVVSNSRAEDFESRAKEEADRLANDIFSIL
jgi:multimeric flavodoxin WrbA